MASFLILQVLLVALAPSLADIAMKFIKYPESVTAPVGDNVTFVCKVNVPGERFTWRWRPADNPDGSWTDLAGTTDKDMISTKLDIEVKPDAVTTLYQCVVWYAAISLVSVPARLTVARLNMKAGGSRKRVVTVPPHNTVALHCNEPPSEPPAIIQWWKETKNPRHPIESRHGVLVVHNVTGEDSGTYICSARNELTREEEDVPEKIILKVERDDGHTRFLEGDVGIEDRGVQTLPIRLNTTVQLWCGIVGVPVPRVIWSRDKKPRTTHRHEQALTISSFSTDDEDIYTCASKGLRRSWKLVGLQAPRWNGSATNVTAGEGGEVHINCGALYGYPRPTVRWLLNSEELVSGKGIHANDTSLFIERVEKRHAGIVQCFACNDLGCAYDAALLIVVPVEISNQEYSPETPKTMHSSQSSKKHKKRKQLVPPSRPNVTRFSDESVMLTWSHANKGLPVEFFKIQYRLVDNNSDKVEWQTDTARIQPLTHSHQIDGLTPNMSYKFRVAAVYSNKDNKQGPSSPPFFLKKGGFEGPAAPVFTSVKPLSSTSVQLFWTWSKDEGGVEPEGFYVYYRTVSTAGSYEKVMVSGGKDSRSAIVTHLLPATKYEFKMLSYTAQAPSNFSTIKEAKTLAAKLTEESTRAPQSGKEPESNSSPPTLVTAGGALGAAALLLVLVVTLLLCRRAKRPTGNKEKGSVPESVGANGYIPAKVPITITANPMHAEGGDGGVEMSFIHNNNTGNDDTLPHSRKNGPARQYV